MTNTAAELVAKAKSEIHNMSVAEVAEALEDGDVTLVDIREPEEIKRTGAIPGAVHAPRGMLEFYADPSSPYHRDVLDPAARTVVYCASGGRSALATQTLRTMGYKDVAHLDGGITAWLDQGRPVTHESS